MTVIVSSWLPAMSATHLNATLSAFDSYQMVVSAAVAPIGPILCGVEAIETISYMVVVVGAHNLILHSVLFRRLLLLPPSNHDLISKGKTFLLIRHLLCLCSTLNRTRTQR